MTDQLFRSLSIEFTNHSGKPEGVFQNVPAHYDIRAFHNADLTVPRTMPDFRYWDVPHFNGSSMITLSTPRSVIGRSISAHTMAEIDSQDQDELNSQTIQDIELYGLASGDEGWPIGDSSVVYGKNAAFRYSNTMAITLVGGVTKTVSSTFRDNILADFPADGSTYFIEMALPNFPAQAAGSHLDLANSFIDFTSDAAYAPARTDSIRFNQSLNSLTAGGNTFWRINRNLLTNVDLANLVGIRFRLLSVGAMTMTAQALRIYKSGDWNYPVAAVDTKRDTMRRSVPQAGALTSEPTGNLGILHYAGARPKNIKQVARFNTGHHPPGGNTNYLAFYARYDPVTQNSIRFELTCNSTESRILVWDRNDGATWNLLYETPAGANVLTEEHDYYFVVEAENDQIRATVYPAIGAFFGKPVFSSDWRTTPRTARGYIAFDFNPYNYDFSLDYIKNLHSEFARYESATLRSLTPVRGATLYPLSSPPRDLSNQKYISSGDTTVERDPNFGNPAPAWRFTRTGESFFGGWQTQDMLFIGDPRHLIVTGQIFPSVVFDRTYRVFLIDKYDTIAWMAYLTDLRAGQWNDINIPVNADIAPADYRFVMQQIGFHDDTFWMQDLQLAHDTIAWSVSPDNGGRWYDVFNVHSKPYNAINFDVLSYKETVLDVNPVAYWRLNESTSPITDVNGNFAGTFSSGITTGQIGAIVDSTDRSFTFDGSGTGISVADSSLLSFPDNKFTIEFMFRATDTTTHLGVLSKAAGGNWEYIIRTDLLGGAAGTLYFETRSFSNQYAYPPLSWVYDTQWHHVVWTADGVTSRLFIDGLEVMNGAKTRELVINSGFETDTSGWTVISGTLARTTTSPISGTGSGLLTASTTGAMFAYYTAPVTAGHSYSATGKIRGAGAQTRLSWLQFRWLDAGSVDLGASGISNQAVPVTTGFTTLTLPPQVAPPGAVTALVFYVIDASGTPAIGDNYRLDDLSVLQTDSPITAASMGNGTAPLSLGWAYNYAAGLPMRGGLDEIVFLNHSLTEEQVWNHYQVSKANKTLTGLKVRASALSDEAWVQGYKLFPRYGYSGQYKGGIIAASLNPGPQTTLRTCALRVTGSPPADPPGHFGTGAYNTDAYG
jgi:hypothetical protein